MTRPAFFTIATLLITAFLASAQTATRPTTFLNLPWGSSRSEVVRAASANGAEVPEDVSAVSDGKLEFTGGSFAGQQVTQWSIEFVRGKMVAAIVTLKAADGNSGALYRDLKQQLVKKYGPAPAERKFSTLSAEQRRSLIASGVRAPNRGTAVTWRFLPTLNEKETLSLTCEHAPPMGSDTADEAEYFVTLRYVHESLRAQLAAETEVIEQGKPRAIQPRDL